MTIKDRLKIFGVAGFVAGAAVYTYILVRKFKRKDLREIAREIAFAWKDKLGLSLKQAYKLQDIIVEYTLRKNQVINSDLPELEKIKNLQQVQVSEHKDLRKILTLREFETYVGMNRRTPNKNIGSISV